MKLKEVVQLDCQVLTSCAREDITFLCCTVHKMGVYDIYVSSQTHAKSPKEKKIF